MTVSDPPRWRRVHLAADRAKPLRATVGRKGRFPIVDWVRRLVSR